MTALFFLVCRRQIDRDPFVRELMPSASDGGTDALLRFPDGLIRKPHHKKARQSVVYVRFHPGRLSRQAIKAGCKYSRVHKNLFLLVLAIIYIILSYVPEFSNHFLVNKKTERIPLSVWSRLLSDRYSSVRSAKVYRIIFTSVSGLIST